MSSESREIIGTDFIGLNIILNTLGYKKLYARRVS